MADMEGYAFKLVCVDENNPLEYRVLTDENFEDLDKIHEFIQRHIHEHNPDFTKWMLIPFRKLNVVVGGSV